MSDEIIYIIPDDENYQPEMGVIELVNQVLNNHKLMFSCELKSSNVIRFYDCGENFEKVQCPCCKEVLSIEWWQDEMCRASESNFEDLDLILPCCNRNSSLNKLEYSFPQGFAKFSIEIINYDKSEYSIENELIPELYDVTGVGWKAIFAHY